MRPAVPLACAALLALPAAALAGSQPAADLAYDARLRASAAAAERFQGPLDGGWILAAGGGDLYAFQLVDKGDRLDGAWRDLRRPGDPAASGFLDEIRRTADGLTLRFTPPGEAPVTVALGPELGGRAEQGGRAVAAALRRRRPEPREPRAPGPSAPP